MSQDIGESDYETNVAQGSAGGAGFDEQVSEEAQILADMADTAVLLQRAREGFNATVAHRNESMSEAYHAGVTIRRLAEMSGLEAGSLYYSLREELSSRR